MATPIKQSSGAKSTTTTVTASSSAVLFAANTNATSRKIYNPPANGILYILYAAEAATAANATEAIASGATWTMPRQLGGVEYSGEVRGLLATGTSVNVTEIE